MSCEGNGKEVKLVTLINEAFQRASGQASSPTAIKRRDYRWVWLLASVVITAAITYSLTRVVDSSQTTMVAVEQYDATLGKAVQNIADPAIDAPSIAYPGIAASSVTPEPASEPERMSTRYESLYSEAESTRIAEREAFGFRDRGHHTLTISGGRGVDGRRHPRRMVGREERFHRAGRLRHREGEQHGQTSADATLQHEPHL